MQGQGAHPLHIRNIFEGTDHGTQVASNRRLPRQDREDVGFQLGSAEGDVVVLTDDVFSQDQIGLQ